MTRRWRPSSSQALLLVGDCRLLLVVESIVDPTYAACFLIPACVPSWAAPVLLALLVGDCRLLLVVHVHPGLLVVLFPDSLLSCSSRPPPRGVPSCGVSSAPGPLFGDDMTPLHHAGCVREGADDDDDASLVDGETCGLRVVGAVMQIAATQHPRGEFGQREDTREGQALVLMSKNPAEDPLPSRQSDDPIVCEVCNSECQNCNVREN